MQVNSQHKTAARIRHEHDMRNTYTMIATVWVFAQFLDPNMLYNWDATQFAIEKGLQGDVIVVKSEDAELPNNVKSSGEIGISMKYVRFHSSAGDYASAVYLIADPNMGIDEVVTHSVPGLVNDAKLGSAGWFCLRKTRQGNCNCYKCSAQTVAVPFVRSCSAISQSSSPDGRDMRAFVTCDGVEAQMKIFQEETMLSLFRDSLIDFGKTPASCSAICQSSNVSSYFRSMKTSLKSVKVKDWRNEALSKKFKSFLSARINSGITSCNQSKIVEGLKKISFSVQKNTEKECSKKWVLHVRPRCSHRSKSEQRINRGQVSCANETMQSKNKY